MLGGTPYKQAVSHILDTPLVNQPNKVCRDSNQTKILTSSFNISDSLWCKNYGHNEMLKLLDINKNNPDNIKYTIKLFRRNTMGSFQPQMGQFT